MLLNFWFLLGDSVFCAHFIFFHQACSLLVQVSTMPAGTAVPMRQLISRKALHYGLTQAGQLSIHIEALVCSRMDTSLPHPTLRSSCVCSDGTRPSTEQTGADLI